MREIHLMKCRMIFEGENDIGLEKNCHSSLTLVMYGMTEFHNGEARRSISRTCISFGLVVLTCAFLSG